MSLPGVVFAQGLMSPGTLGQMLADCYRQLTVFADFEIQLTRFY